MRIHRLPLFAVALSPLIISGCVTNNRVTLDRQTYKEIDKASLKAPCRSSLRICVTNAETHGFMGSVNAERTKDFRRVFSSAVQTAAPSPDVCDLAIRFTETTTDSIDVYAPAPPPAGDFIARFEVGNANLTMKALCRALAPGGLLADRMPEILRASAAAVEKSKVAAAEAAPAPAATPAVAPQGLSAADIARIAKAVRAPETPRPAPAAQAETSTPDFTSPERPDDLAVIVGIESYSNIPAKAAYAERDAVAFKAYARALGVPERNIVLLTGSKAVRSALTRNIEGWLPRVVKPDSRVYFYFSGHGAPDAKTGQAYLVPWDGDPDFLDATAYPLPLLYRKLGELPAKQVFVAMDSCFSGAGGRSVLASGARPLLNRIETGAVTGRVTALTASAATEISGSLDEKGHGAFTYFLLEGLNGAAKDAQGRVTAKSLHDYLTPRVEDEARRLNRDQTPQLLGADPGLVLR